MVIVSVLIDPCVCVVNLYCLYSPLHPLSFHKPSHVYIVSIRSLQPIRASPCEILAPDVEYDWFDCFMTVPRWCLQTWPEPCSTDSLIISWWRTPMPTATEGTRLRLIIRLCPRGFGEDSLAVPVSNVRRPFCPAAHGQYKRPSVKGQLVRPEEKVVAFSFCVLC